MSPSLDQGSGNPHAADDRTSVILDSIADGVFTVDSKWMITSFNRAAEKITGVPRDEAIGRPCCEVFRANICESDCALRQTVDTGKSIINRSVYIVSSEGKQVPISISTALLRDREGQVIGGVETFRDLSLVEELRKELARRHTFADMISANHEMHKIFDILPEVAESDSTVLIEGESGTGKELLARAIHHLSPRRKGPLVTVNCGALPDTLLESELFGYKAGAFTDARKDKPGRFARAQGGTIFLDEIGDISTALQVRLLRVIEEKAFEPLGGTRQITADVRVVTATNKDLAAAIRKGLFRSDLFYRINVLSIRLPPLRERREDIPLLVENFIDHFNRLRGKEISGVSAEVFAVLMEHDFPGNIRELENIVEHASVICRGGLIRSEHLPDHLRPRAAVPAATASMSLRDLEARHIYEALRQNRWHRSATARQLGIHKSTLWRKMKQLGIDAPDAQEHTVPHNLTPDQDTQ